MADRYAAVRTTNKLFWKIYDRKLRINVPVKNIDSLTRDWDDFYTESEDEAVKVAAGYSLGCEQI